MLDEPPPGMVRLYFVTEFAIHTNRTHHCVVFGLRTKDPQGILEPQEYQCMLHPEQAMEIGRVLQHQGETLLKEDVTSS